MEDQSLTYTSHLERLKDEAGDRGNERNVGH